MATSTRPIFVPSTLGDFSTKTPAQQATESPTNLALMRPNASLGFVCTGLPSAARHARTHAVQMVLECASKAPHAAAALAPSTLPDIPFADLLRSQQLLRRESTVTLAFKLNFGSMMNFHRISVDHCQGSRCTPNTAPCSVCDIAACATVAEGG